MSTTNQLPEPDLGYIKTDISNQPAFSARQMREAMKHALQARAQATQAEVTDAQIKMLIPCGDAWKYEVGFPEAIQFARAILALRPERVPMTPREIELIDGMIAVQLDHAQRCDAISNRAMAEKQKGWDMERVELLRRIRSFGITAQTKKETP